MKHLYKKSLLLAVLLSVMALSMVSCSDSPDSLSDGRARRVLNKEMERTHVDQNYVALKTGFFECNENLVRYRYRQLAANELITYKCAKVKKVESVKKTRRVKRNYYYYSYFDTETYYTKDTVDTYFITVQLTEKGKAFVVDSLPEPDPSEDDEDVSLANKKLAEEFDSTKFPESKVPLVEFPEDRLSNDVVSEEEIIRAEADIPDDMPDDGYVIGKNDLSEYEMAKSQEKITLVNVKAYKINVLKVRNIALSNTGVPTAKGEAVLEADDVTPFGRILSRVLEKERHTVDVEFVFYQDKGWRLKKD